MKIVITPTYEYLRNFIETLPQCFGNEGECIYQGRNEIRVFQVGEEQFVVKSFKIPNVINKIVYAYFRDSKAKRSYNNGLVLTENNIGTPDPVAYVETYKCGFFDQSYYVSQFKHYPGIMRELRTGSFEEEKDLIRDFAYFTASIHEKGVLHKDYSPGNILYDLTDGEYQFALVDINRMTFEEVDLQTGCHNFRRLWGYDKMIHYLGEEYGKARGFDAQECADLTLKYHQDFWENYGKKHNGAKPYAGPDVIL